MIRCFRKLFLWFFVKFLVYIEERSRAVLSAMHLLARNLTYRTDNEEQKVNEVESDRRFGGCFPVALDA